jgi:hypothetical protein
VFLTQLGINHVESLLTALEAFLDEGKKRSIFFIGVVKEGTDVAVVTERCASEPYRLARFGAEPLFCLIAVFSRVHFFSLLNWKIVAVDFKSASPAASGW